MFSESWCLDTTERKEEAPLFGLTSSPSVAGEIVRKLNPDVKNPSCSWLSRSESRRTSGVIENMLKLVHLYETLWLGFIVNAISLWGRSQQHVVLCVVFACHHIIHFIHLLKKCLASFFFIFYVHSITSAWPKVEIKGEVRIKEKSTYVPSRTLVPEMINSNTCTDGLSDHKTMVMGHDTVTRCSHTKTTTTKTITAYCWIPKDEVDEERRKRKKSQLSSSKTDMLVRPCGSEFLHIFWCWSPGTNQGSLQIWTLVVVPKCMGELGPTCLH